MDIAAPFLCGRCDAANNGKSDAGGGPFLFRGFMSVQSGNVAKFTKSPLLTASSAASGNEEGVHPMRTNNHRREAEGNHCAGASRPRQLEGMSV